jgi:hypothetical protein
MAHRRVEILAGYSTRPLILQRLGKPTQPHPKNNTNSLRQRSCATSSALRWTRRAALNFGATHYA